MAKKDWHEAWHQDEIGFHQSRTNQFLAKFGKQVLGESPGRVLVPLCGKSLDMVHLAGSADHVVGVEFVEKAVSDFFDERELTPVIDRTSHMSYSAGAYTLFAADFFAITANDLGPIDAVFDRASMVALDDATRVRYAAHMATLVPSGATSLLVTFDYDQSEMHGPPFAVPETEVRSLYEPNFEIELLETKDVLTEFMVGRGLTAMWSSAFSMKRR